ncbi:hypothetical protein [Deinococcus alpinitundrae]|uniref:hypothetical protein n=1 Tax=Deinococcus alpinitundrae TaxID=468913 RepID=UPI001ED961A3|nr:hypothetical protein [Deinococcus alpinitundrae]
MVAETVDSWIRACTVRPSAKISSVLTRSQKSPTGFKRQGRQISNAVPSVLGRVIGRWILAHLGRAEIAGPFTVRDGFLPV